VINSDQFKRKDNWTMPLPPEMKTPKPTYVVEAGKLLSSHPRELWAYRELFLLLVKRDFIAVYKQTVLGPLWFFVQPFLAFLVYMIVFGQIARLPTTNLPPLVFYMSGIIAWSFFSNCLIQVARLIIPLSQITMNLLLWLLALNPMASLIECYRSSMFGTEHTEVEPAIIATVITLVVAITGLWCFAKAEGTFTDSV
jgi:lipopolysaccharide transport system permease protein